MYQLNDFRKSTPLQNRQFMVLVSECERHVDEFVGELTSKK
jgi:hypothetical protein